MRNWLFSYGFTWLKWLCFVELHITKVFGYPTVRKLWKNRTVRVDHAKNET
jgi:hypothetical protein